MDKCIEAFTGNNLNGTEVFDNYGVEKIREAVKPETDQQVRDRLIPAAKDGDGDSQVMCELGFRLIGDYQIPQDIETGEYWLTKAAECSYAPAEFLLGYLFYERGCHNTKGQELGISLLENAAGQEYLPAVVKLIDIYTHCNTCPYHKGCNSNFFSLVKCFEKTEEYLKKLNDAAAEDSSLKPLAKYMEWRRYKNGSSNDPKHIDKEKTKQILLTDTEGFGPAQYALAAFYGRERAKTHPHALQLYKVVASCEPFIPYTDFDDFIEDDEDIITKWLKVKYYMWLNSFCLSARGKLAHYYDNGWGDCLPVDKKKGLDWKNKATQLKSIIERDFKLYNRFEFWVNTKDCSQYLLNKIEDLHDFK